MRNLISLVSIKKLFIYYAYLSAVVSMFFPQTNLRMWFCSPLSAPTLLTFCQTKRIFINIYFLLPVNFITQTISKAPTVTEYLKHASYKSIHLWNDFTFYWVPKTISFNVMFLQKVGNRDSLQIPFLNYLWNVMTFSKEIGVVSSLNGPGFK